MLGVYGGTFDPVHFGHLRTALEVTEQLGLRQLRMVPCHVPALRGSPRVSAADRAHMLKLAVQGLEQLQVDERELQRSGPSYSRDTLHSLRQETGRDEPICMVIGSDAFCHLSRWYRWQELFDLAHVVVLRRPGYELEGAQELLEFIRPRTCGSQQQLAQQPAGLVHILEVTRLDISATRIREILQAGKNPRFLLPEPVLGYIRRNRLYSDPLHSAEVKD